VRHWVWTLAALFLAGPAAALESPPLKSSQSGVKPSSDSDILVVLDKFCKTGKGLPDDTQSSYAVPFPEDMLVEHVRWHTCPKDFGGRKISIGRQGAGKEFLDWHHVFIARYMAWRKRKGLQPISAWKELPVKLAAADTFDPVKIIRYPSLDELGREIERSIHGTMHSRLSAEYKDPSLGRLTAPRSFYFWKLHGLIDAWRQAWIDTCANKKLRCGPENLKSSSKKR
jgi:hypothetical protein